MLRSLSRLVILTGLVTITPVDLAVSAEIDIVDSAALADAAQTAKELSPRRALSLTGQLALAYAYRAQMRKTRILMEVLDVPGDSHISTIVSVPTSVVQFILYFYTFEKLDQISYKLYSNEFRSYLEKTKALDKTITQNDRQLRSMLTSKNFDKSKMQAHVDALTEAGESLQKLKGTVPGDLSASFRNKAVKTLRLGGTTLFAFVWAFDTFATMLQIAAMDEKSMNTLINDQTKFIEKTEAILSHYTGRVGSGT